MFQRNHILCVLGSLLMVVASFANVGVPMAHAQDGAPVYAGQSPEVLQAKIDIIQDELRTEQQELRDRAERAKHAAKAAKRRKAGAAPRMIERWDEAPLTPAQMAMRSRTQPMHVEAMPTNVQHNNKAGDAASTTNSENSVAMDGQYGVASWNDGLGGASGFQGMGYTTNGGASWTDIGALPTNGTITSWNGDPVTAVNTTTHEFYVVGFGISLQQIAMVKISFPGGVFTMTGPFLIHARTGADAIDKPWFTVDPGTGNLYATWTNFTAGTNRIEYKRSTDGGATWSAVQIMNSAGANGRVQGSRPQVGPAGEVYVVWYQIGAVDADFAMIRKSADFGVTFGAEATAVSYFTNFGTGAPGFNRLRSIDNPSIGVDRSAGPNSGRVYVAVNETINWYDDPLGGGGSLSEVESNNTTGTANPFTPGQRLRGSLAAASSSPDYYSFTATQGTTYIFWCDSLATMFYTMRIFCSDGVTSLVQGGDNSGCPGSQGFLVWTAPANGTYYFRLATISGNVAGCPTNTAGGYRVQTGVNTNPGAGAEVARDHRDIFVAYSDNAVAWTKVRANDDVGLLDDFLPEVQVACDGHPYVLWYDWRDAIAINCGGQSASYVSRSTNGGATYGASQRVASALTNWNTALSNLAPNMGDYIGLHASTSNKIAMAWGDGRLGDVDEFGACTDCNFTLSSCPPNQSVVALPGVPYTLPLTATINNPNILFDNTYTLTVTNSAGWSSSVPASITVGAGGSAVVNYSVDVPPDAVPGVVHICLEAHLNGNAQVQICCFDLTVDQPVATLASVALVNAASGRAEIEWMVSTSAAVNVYRSQDNAAWEMLGTQTPDGTGRVTFVDHAVSGGQRYEYRLGIPTAGGETFAGAVWVDVPASAEFSLRAMQNPIQDGLLTVSFALPSAGSATLEVVDLGGRRLLRQDVGSFGVGSHVLALRQLQGKLPEGIYMMRLTQDGRTLTSKVSVIH